MPAKTDNRTNGGRFEQELAGMLYRDGFWVHVLQQNKSGQPADIIAVDGHLAMLIDAKVVSGNEGFPLRRVEENQQYAMKRFTTLTGKTCWFAVKMPGGDVRMLSSVFVFSMIDNGFNTISDAFLRETALSYREWLLKVREPKETPYEDDMK